MEVVDPKIATENCEGCINNILLQEEPPDKTQNQNTVASRGKLTESFDQVSNSLHSFIYNDSIDVLMNLLNLIASNEKIISVEKSINQISYLESHVKDELDELTQSEFCSVVYDNSMTAITHLILAKNVENISGTKEKQQGPKPQRNNGDVESEKGDFTKTTTLLPKEVSNTPWRGIIHSLLIKEEPPDVPHRSYPNPTPIVTLGKFLDSLLYEDTNLLYFGAGLEVSRTKPFQGGGYDEDIRTKVNLGEETMHTDENFIANDKEEMIDDASIVYEKAYGTTTTSERDCTVRTAGLDPDPIGDSGTFLVVGTVAPEESPSTCTTSQTTQEQEFCLNIHSETTYLKDFDRAKLPKEPANWKESNLKQFSRFTLSEPTNPDRSSSSHALMFSNTHLETTCCFRMPKTASKPVPRICPRRSHLPYTDLPYVDQGAFKPQRLFSDPLRHESRHIQDLQTVPRHSSFGPKLSRLKPSRNLPYLARLLHKFTNGHIHLICTISFCFLVLRML